MKLDLVMFFNRAEFFYELMAALTLASGASLSNVT